MNSSNPNYLKTHDLKTDKIPVIVENLIELLISQRFQIQLTPRMFPVWDFMVGVFARKAILDMGWVLSTLSWQDLYVINENNRNYKRVFYWNEIFKRVNCVDFT